MWGGKLPRPTQTNGTASSQPAAGNDRATTTTTTQKKRHSRKGKPERHDGNETLGPAPGRRDLQPPGYGNSVSDLAGLPGFTPHIRSSIHPPTLEPIFWCCTDGEGGNPQIGPCRPPPLPTSPEEKKTLPKAPTVQATHPPTGYRLDTKKGVA